MRALVCSSLEGIDSLEVGDLEVSRPGRGEVRVEIESAGVNFPDLLVIRGLYQDQPPLPFAPGMEIAGTVAEVGEGVGNVAVGDRVFSFVAHGGYAEEVVVPSDALFPLPEGMTSDVAASLPIAYGTSYHALIDRADLQAGEKLLVLGAAGGVGMAAVQIGKALGARVIAAVSSEEKEQAVRASGADDVIRYDRSDLREELKRLTPAGVDVVYDPVGGEATEAAFRSTAWKGRHLVIGFAAGDIPALPVNLALLKGSSLVGVFWGRFAATEPVANRANMASLTEWWKEGRIDPVVSETYPLAQAPDALRRIGSRGAIGKLIVHPRE